jgi:cytosine/uracil/thiamine/allantoin permease
VAATIPDPHPRTDDASGAAPPASGRAGRVEAHGVDHIPDSERHGRPRELFSVSNALQLAVVLTGPLMAVYATDIVLRRGRYDGAALSDETPNSPFWYTGGVNGAGALALGAGVASAALSVNTLYAGPVADALGGVDLSLPVGMVVSAAVYAVLMRKHATVRATRAGA